MSFSYKNQTLHAESVAITDLMNAYGSPLYVYSRSAIERNYQKFDQAFAAHPHLICYAVKANSNLAVLNVLAKLGAGFDILSAGELARVLAAGGQANRCIFSGVGKTKDEIKQALEAGIHCLNVESSAELERIESIAQTLNTTAPIAIRVNPNVDAKTHPYISTGLRENKFGVAIEDAFDLYQHIHHSQHLKVMGLACHIGSQITEVEPFLDALNKVLALVKQLEENGIEIAHLDLGGGVGIQYKDEQTIDIQAYIEAICNKVGGRRIVLEPGRAIVGNAGIFVTQVEFLKQNQQHSFAIVDGAMNDLLRPAFYQAYHRVLPVNENANGVNAQWDVVGPICETGDFLAKDRNLSLAMQDYLAIMDAGAYGFVMSSNYNARPRVAEVMVQNTHHQLVRERETIQDLFKQENIFND